MLRVDDIVSSGNTFYIVGGIIVAALLIVFFVFIWRFEGVNYIKQAYMKERFRGRIDDITNPQENDEIKDRKR